VAGECGRTGDRLLRLDRPAADREATLRRQLLTARAIDADRAGLAPPQTPPETAALRAGTMEVGQEEE